MKCREPESLLYDDSSTAATFVSLVFLVRTISVLNDRRRFSTPTKPLLRIVATKLALYQHRSLSHSLEVHELQQSKTQDNVMVDCRKHRLLHSSTKEIFTGSTMGIAENTGRLVKIT